MIVKAFPGATVSDMRSYIKPTIDKSPDQILLHIGTNDLKHCEPSTVADNIVDLVSEIEANCNAEIILSELMTRRDSFNSDVKTVNKRLNQFCRQHQWKFVRHNNITANELNRGGLHLNREGYQLLYENILDSISH